MRRSACGNKIAPTLCSRVCKLTAVMLRIFSQSINDKTPRPIYEIGSCRCPAVPDKSTSGSRDRPYHISRKDKRGDKTRREKTRKVKRRPQTKDHQSQQRNKDTTRNSRRD